MTKLYPTYCIFQDMVSRKTIGTAEVQAGLYLLTAKAAKGIQCNSIDFELHPVESSSRSNKNSVVMLWHYRLGHLNFMYLEKLLPDYSSKKIIEIFIVTFVNFLNIPVLCILLVAINHLNRSH